MSEFLFRVPCPAEGCDDSELRNWHHDGCPSSSHIYLTDQGLLRCDHCGEKFKIFDITLKSTSCSHDYRETSLMRILKILCIAEQREGWPSSFTKKTIQSLKEQML